MAVFSSSSWSKIWIYDIILTGVYTVWQILFCFSIRIDKRSKYSRRRTFDEDADIDYINERNMKFNKKLERFYGPYTTEIKQNLERGTAVWNDWLPIVAGLCTEYYVKWHISIQGRQLFQGYGSWLITCIIDWWVLQVVCTLAYIEPFYFISLVWLAQGANVLAFHWPCRLVLWI